MPPLLGWPLTEKDNLLRPPGMICPCCSARDKTVLLCSKCWWKVPPRDRSIVAAQFRASRDKPAGYAPKLFSIIRRLHRSGKVTRQDWLANYDARLPGSRDEEVARIVALHEAGDPVPDPVLELFLEPDDQPPVAGAAAGGVTAPVRAVTAASTATF